MKLTRQRQILSWLIVIASTLLMFFVHEAFFLLLVGVLLLRPDISDPSYTLALITRYRWAVYLSGTYAVAASGIILWITLVRDKSLITNLGTSSLFILFWPLFILICFYEYELFRST